MEQGPSLHLSVVAIEKGAFGSPSTTDANFYIIEFEIPTKSFRFLDERIYILLSIDIIPFKYISLCRYVQLNADCIPEE